MEDISNDSDSLIKPETIEKIVNTQKIISLIHDKKMYTIEFKNEINYLYIIASYHESLFPIKYQGKFTLDDIKKVGLFRAYDSIDECLFEIFEGLNSDPTLTEKDSQNIIIKVPLLTRKFPEITFALKKVEKNESQKYDDLVNVLLKMKNEKDEKDKEIKELKNKLEKIEKILNISKEKKENNEENIQENFDGTKIEIFTIGNDEYSNFFPEKNIFKENINGFVFSLILECNEKEIKNVVESFNKYKDDIKSWLNFNEQDKLLVDFNIIDSKNKIIINCFIKNEIFNDKENQNKKDFIFDDLLIDKDTYPLLGIFATYGMKLNLKTKINLVDMCEITEGEKIKNLIYDTKLDFKGDILIYKILLGFITIAACKAFFENNFFPNDINNNNFYKICIDLLNDIYLSVINGNLNYSLNNKELLDNSKEIIKKIINLIKFFAIQNINLFKDPKYRIFQKINFNKIKVGIFGFPKYKVGVLGLILESPKNNEFIDKVINGKIKLEEEEKKDDSKIEEKEEKNEEEREDEDSEGEIRI